jgi:hypothetical protein
MLARFGLGLSFAARGGFIVEFLLRMAEKFADGLIWMLKGLIRRLVGGADHISKNVYSAVLVLLVVTIAWKFGPGDWRFWSRGIEPPAASQPAARAPASRSAPRQAPRCTDPLSACFWDSLF